MTVTMDDLLDAILPHVAFDGWGEAAFTAAASDLDVAVNAARTLARRGAIDLAAAYHRRGDAAMQSAMLAALETAAPGSMRYSEKVALAVWLRIEAGDREVVRRGTALFALPQHAVEGAALIWGTADAIWRALGDTSDDLNWYSKRAILSGVYSATVLFWLGDQSEGDSATRDFLDRRIGDVMKFEKMKAGLRDNAALRPVVAGLDRLLSSVRAPGKGAAGVAGGRGLPGRWHK